MSMDLIHQGKGNNRYTQRPYTLCHTYTLIALEWPIMKTTLSFGIVRQKDRPAWEGRPVGS